MKKRFLGALLSVLLICSMLTGCAQIKNAVESGVQSAMNEASSEIKSALDEASSEIRSALDEASSDIESALKGESGKESSSKKESSASSQASGSYTMADVKKLKNTGHFAKNTLEHIFDGTINSKGKATGYHYDGISDSKGSIIAGTESKPDEHGVYTAKVEVDGVKKNGFSSFYPTPHPPRASATATSGSATQAIWRSTCTSTTASRSPLPIRFMRGTEHDQLPLRPEKGQKNHSRRSL